MPINQQFTLARTQSASIGDTNVQVQFVEVTGDSRCPADAICIQGGDAVVRVRVVDGGSTVSYDLHTGDSSKGSVVHRQLRLSLDQLQPYPFSSKPTSPDDYRATFTVTRTP